MWPIDLQGTAAQMHRYRALQEPLANAAGDRRTSARAAGQGFTAAPLVYTQANLMGREPLHETHVDPARKAWMVFNTRPQLLDRCAVDLIHEQYRMGVAHGDDADRIDCALDIQRVQRLILFRLKWQRCRSKAR